jgi:broad specificity phosphatase PhoE
MNEFLSPSSTRREIPEDSHEASEENLGKVDIFLQRHGQTGSEGWLSSDGIEQVRLAAHTVAEQYLRPDSPPVTFFILNSDSARFVNREAVGKRAEQSGEVTAETIHDLINIKGLSQDKVQVHSFGKKTKNGTRAYKKLREPDYHYVGTSPTPTAYKDALIEKFGPEGREEAFFNEAQELEDLREEVGAESSSELAVRVLKMIRVINRYAEAYRRAHPGRKLVFLLESHGDLIRSLIQHGLNIEASQGWQPNYGEVVPIGLEDGMLNMDYKGLNYERSLTKP